MHLMKTPQIFHTIKSRILLDFYNETFLKKEEEKTYSLNEKTLSKIIKEETKIV